nr:Chain B, B54NLS [synthetic construct]2YNR_C Chain C, B54NLS [synthetic construct]2YNS_C Chain C, B54NLS [synthetic construct]2YNS_D Chain D, B54NLS [synthetic construct]
SVLGKRKRHPKV